MLRGPPRGSCAAPLPVDRQGCCVSPRTWTNAAATTTTPTSSFYGQITARFGIEDLVFMMDNPQTDVRFAGA